MILSGRDPDPNSPYNYYVIWRVDTLGNPDTLYISPLTLKYAYQVFRKGNTYYVGGTRRTTSGAAYNVKVFIDRFDLSFVLNASWNPSVTMNEYFHQLLTFKDTLYLAAEVTDYEPPNPNPVYRLRIGQIPTGYLLACNTIGPFSPTPFWSDVLVMDNNLLAVSYNDYDNSLYFLDSFLTQTAVSPYGYSPDPVQVTNNICAIPGNKIAGTGTLFADSLHSQDHVSFLTENVLAFLATITGTVEIPTTDQIRVYPNPFSEKICIRNLPAGEACHVEVIRVSGQKVWESMVAGQMVVDTGSFPPGVYLVNIWTNTGMKSVKVIKGISYKS
jgi:hypothetical protein